MTPEQIFAVVAALVAGEPDPSFEQLKSGGHDSRYPVTVEPCELPPGTLEVEGQTVLCGIVDVPETYDAPDGPRIALEFAILKARSQSPVADPLVYLHGGPGGGTLQMLGPVAEILYANHRQTRDIVTFDQRAAALSGSTVTCHQNTAENLVKLVGVAAQKLPRETLNALVAPCVDEILASGVNLRAYNTENNARDVRALTQALGYPSYNIYGISYGTKLALEVLRTEPDGVRSVVLDGVAPLQVRLYDDLVGPYARTIDVLIEQCRGDADCSKAYPDLKASIDAAFLRLAENPIPAARGQEEIGFLQLFDLVFKQRNNWRIRKTITPYLPRIFTELAEGNSTAFDAVMSVKAPNQVISLSETSGLTADERALVRVALETAEAMADMEEAVVTAIERLKKDLAEDRETTSIAEAFEARSNAAASTILDQDALAALIRDYALLQTQEPGQAPLVQWVSTHFSGADRDALTELVAAMSDADIARTFEIADGQATKYETVLGGVVNNHIFACQEDVPYNTVEGFHARVTELAEEYAFLELFRDNTSFFENCEAFPKHPREGFQTPVVSDLPVLVLNGVLDIQTSWQWGAVAVETLENGQNLVFPEAGHGSIAYQPCANDISVAFVNDPTSKLDTSCIDRIKVDFVMPDDPLPQ
ncbi:alpha/beta fold hydrolase [Ruegeria arenilitoris]|uniref:alpha/beta fold hydrolase n=1 Tax=Ruegeria arenilitoris TaxID=1173585 RepID=UPI00147D1370|nr:alpha/beta hydrolase [Ruegeria arenilitoris]